MEKKMIKKIPKIPYQPLQKKKKEIMTLTKTPKQTQMMRIKMI